MTRDQRIWDAIFTSSFAFAIHYLGGIGPRQHLTNGQIAHVAAEAARAADRGVDELKDIERHRAAGDGGIS